MHKYDSSATRLLGILARLVIWFSPVAAIQAELEPEPQRPNIVILLADDLGYGDLGVHGCPDIPTPRIDSIAMQGVRCTNGYVSGPYCSPTRAGLLTGRYQQRFGHEFNPGPGRQARDDVGLTRNERTLAERLQTAGYATGLVGKWHLGGSERLRPLARGFDEFYGFLGGAHPYRARGGEFASMLRGNEQVEETEYLTDALGREAVAFIDRHADQPFFLYLAFNAVHAPMQGAGRLEARFQDLPNPRRRTYANMLTALDEAVGQVLRKLDDEKLAQRTLVFFLSDNGGPEHVNASDNGPLRGGKATTWEGGIRVPFLARWPGKIPAGSVYDLPVIQLDIVPTALTAAGIAIQPEDEFDGVDLLPYWMGRIPSPPHESLYWRFGNQWAIRSNDWKLVHGRSDTRVRGGRAEAPRMSDGELYHLAEDLGEESNVAAEHPEVVARLQSQWAAWNGELEDPAWAPPRRNPRNAARRQQRAAAPEKN